MDVMFFQLSMPMKFSETCGHYIVIFLFLHISSMHVMLVPVNFLMYPFDIKTKTYSMCGIVQMDLQENQRRCKLFAQAAGLITAVCILKYVWFFYLSVALARANLLVYSNGLIEMISITLMKLPLLVVFLINEKVGGAASNRTPNLGARYRTVNQYKNLCCNMWWVMLRATSKYNQREFHHKLKFSGNFSPQHVPHVACNIQKNISSKHWKRSHCNI